MGGNPTFCWQLERQDDSLFGLLTFHSRWFSSLTKGYRGLIRPPTGNFSKHRPICLGPQKYVASSKARSKRHPNQRRASSAAPSSSRVGTAGSGLKLLNKCMTEWLVPYFFCRSMKGNMQLTKTSEQGPAQRLPSHPRLPKSSQG